MQGCDKDLCPCIYVKPNYKKRQFKKQELGMKDYFLYMTFILEYVLKQIVEIYDYQEKLSFIVDLDMKEFRLDFLYVLEELLTNHYP